MVNLIGYTHILFDEANFVINGNKLAWNIYYHTSIFGSRDCPASAGRFLCVTADNVKQESQNASKGAQNEEHHFRHNSNCHRYRHRSPRNQLHPNPRHCPIWTIYDFW